MGVFRNQGDCKKGTITESLKGCTAGKNLRKLWCAAVPEIQARQSCRALKSLLKSGDHKFWRSSLGLYYWPSDGSLMCNTDRLHSNGISPYRTWLVSRSFSAKVRFQHLPLVLFLRPSCLLGSSSQFIRLPYTTIGHSKPLAFGLRFLAGIPSRMNQKRESFSRNQ